MSLPNRVVSRPRFIDPKCVEPGDVLLFRRLRPGHLQRAIERAQLKFASQPHARWTHAAVAGPGYRIVEMKARGCTSGHLWEYDLADYEVCIRRVKKVSPEEGLEIFSAAGEYGNSRKAYAFLTLFRLLIAKDDKARRFRPWHVSCFVCSALCAQGLAAIGLDVGKGIPYQLITPSDLSLADALADVPLSYIPGKDFEEWWLKFPAAPHTP